MGDHSVKSVIWGHCAESLQQELSAQQFNTWIRPLVPVADGSFTEFCLMAPNRFIKDWVNDKFLHRIHELVHHFFAHSAMAPPTDIVIKVAARQVPPFQSAPVADTVLPVVAPIPESGIEVNGVKATLETPAAPVPSPTDAAQSLLGHAGDQNPLDFSPALSIGAHMAPNSEFNADNSAVPPSLHSDPMMEPAPSLTSEPEVEGSLRHRSGLNKTFIFDNFVEGKSNQMGLAAAQQVVENPGGSYNPLFIYGGVGLGKTHLMHAVGNGMLARNPNAKIVYLHSERFVADMVKALQLNAINDFKRYYRSVDALLIDDIQFFAGKDRSQEEFFHTFNALLEGNQQIILTCDRYPKVISNLEERLKSRFGWGLTVEVEPPELETRVAILMKRAEQQQVELPHEAAFFIAQRIRSNVRELEGALKRVIANASFTHRNITVDLVREALKDLLALQDKQVSISNIQRVVGDYYKVKIAEFTSKRRSRSVARPRQIAMALAKELTNHSLPEIGDAFGGRDHTTVLHACRKVKELCSSDAELQQDWKNLQRLLTA